MMCKKAGIIFRGVQVLFELCFRKVVRTAKQSSIDYRHAAPTKNHHDKKENCHNNFANLFYMMITAKLVSHPSGY